MTGELVIDAHHHLWDPTRRAHPWMAAEQLTPIRRPYSLTDLRDVLPPEVTSTILVQTVSSVEETAEFLSVAADSEGLIAGVIGWVDLTGDVAGQLDELRALPGGNLLVGIRHQAEDEPDPDWLLRPSVLSGLRALASAGLPYDLLVRAPQRSAAYSLAAALPEVQFVLDHAGKPAIAAAEWQPWATWLHSLAKVPNVTCKISGLVTEANWQTWTPATLYPYTSHILETFGPDRVIFGSDWPVCELAASYEDVFSLATTALATCTEPERNAMLAENARHVYGV